MWGREYCEIVENRFYYEIIDHKNYTPRNVAMICNEIIKNKDNTKKGNIIKNIRDILDDIDLIWKREYDKYNDNEKTLLNIIYILKNAAYESEIKKQFEMILENEHKEYNEDIFEECVRKVSESFVIIKYDAKKKENEYSFINPSIEDFLIKKFRKNTSLLIKYVKYTQNIEPLYNIYITNDDIYLTEKIRNSIQDNFNDFNLDDSYTKKVICQILKGNLNEERNSIIKRIIDISFEKINVQNTDFIMDLLDDKKDEIYNYALEKFKKQEIEDNKNLYQKMAYYLRDIYNLDIYLKTCYKIINEKDSEHMLTIMELLIDSMISIITDETEEVMKNDIEVIYESLKEDINKIEISQTEDEEELAGEEYAETIEKLTNEYGREIIENITYLKKLYSRRNYNYIVGTVLANNEAYLSENEVIELMDIEEENNTKDMTDNESRRYIKKLFEDDLNIDDNNLINMYIQNNLKDKSLISKESKWYITTFFDELYNADLLVNFLNFYKKEPKSFDEFGKEIVEFIQQKNSHEYTESEINFLETYALKCFEEKNKYFKIKNNELEKYQNLFDEADIVKYENETYMFSNIFFVIYFAINKIFNDKINLDYIINEKWKEIELNYIGIKFEELKFEITNAYALKDIKNFNNEYILPFLHYFLSYIRKNNKYEIAKSLINKLEPTIYFNKDLDNLLVYSLEFYEINYIGIDIIGFLLNIDYDKISNIIKNKYLKGENIKINLENAIKDKEMQMHFDKLGLYDYLNNVYLKLNKLYEDVQKDNSIDVYKIYKK